MTHHQRGKLTNSAGIEWIAHDEKRARPALGQGRKSGINFFGRGSVKNLNLSPKVAGSLVDVSQVQFRFRTFGVAEHCNQSALRHQFVQQAERL